MLLLFKKKLYPCPVAGKTLSLLLNWRKFSSLYKVAYKLENEHVQSPFIILVHFFTIVTFLIKENAYKH